MERCRNLKTKHLPRVAAPRCTVLAAVAVVLGGERYYKGRGRIEFGSVVVLSGDLAFTTTVHRVFACLDLTFLCTGMGGVGGIRTSSASLANHFGFIINLLFHSKVNIMHALTRIMQPSYIAL